MNCLKNWLLIWLFDRRGALGTALAGRDDRTLTPILTFLARNINDPAHAEILNQVTNVLLGKILFFSFQYSIIKAFTIVKEKSLPPIAEWEANKNLIS